MSQTELLTASLSEIISMISHDLPGFEWLLRSNYDRKREGRFSSHDAPAFMANVMETKSETPVYFPYYADTPEAALAGAYMAALASHPPSKTGEE